MCAVWAGVVSAKDELGKIIRAGFSLVLTSVCKRGFKESVISFTKKTAFCECD